MNQCTSMPLSHVSADICIVPKWLLQRLENEGEPFKVLADPKKSANILSDEEIIYYLNGIESILQQPELYRLFEENLGVWYVLTGQPQMPNDIFALLQDAARIQKRELMTKYRDENPERSGHIVMGHYLRGPDSSIDLLDAWHTCFEAVNIQGAVYVTYEVKAGHRLPHADRDFCRQLLKVLEPYADRSKLRASRLYATAMAI